MYTIWKDIFIADTKTVYCHRQVLSLCQHRYLLPSLPFPIKPTSGKPAPMLHKNNAVVNRVSINNEGRALVGCSDGGLSVCWSLGQVSCSPLVISVISPPVRQSLRWSPAVTVNGKSIGRNQQKVTPPQPSHSSYGQ